MGDTITIAQLTDVHLGPIRGFGPRHWNVKRATGFYNWRKNRRHAYPRAVIDRIVADMKTQAPDHVAVTGDLVNIGLPGEIAGAHDWLKSVGTPERVSVIPGNHDIYSEWGGDDGVARWADYMRGGGAANGAWDVRAAFPYVRRIGKVALIGVNSAVPTAPLIASGRVGVSQLDRLARLLSEIREAGFVRVVMIHHPPLPGQASRTRGLTDATALEDVLVRQGAELVIHGHNHREMLAWREGPRGKGMAVVGAASSSLGVPHKHEPLARYNIYRIAGAGATAEVTMTTRGIDGPNGPVVELGRRPLSGGVETVMHGVTATSAPGH
jgi:3',5'-cyclic AMP phosphodiesterase CpdA